MFDDDSPLCLEPVQPGKSMQVIHTPNCRPDDVLDRARNL
jgi:hypothetical protein